MRKQRGSYLAAGPPAGVIPRRGKPRLTLRQRCGSEFAQDTNRPPPRERRPRTRPRTRHDTKKNAGAAAASFVLGALAATAISGSALATQTNLETKFSPLYKFKKMDGPTTYDECKKACDDSEENLIIPCITSFDMNDQMRTDLKKLGDPYAWVGHKSEGVEGLWSDEACEDRQKNQFKGDFVNRNGGSFEASFDDAAGCAVLVNGFSETGASSLGLGSDPPLGGPGPNIQHHNWIKDEACDGAAEEGGVICFCQYVKLE